MWTYCACGERHWGRYGAAGLLLTDPGRTGVVLQKRSRMVHHGGTWSVPEAVNEQPWLPNGPINLNVTWTKEGYIRPGNYTVPDSLRVQAAKAASSGVGQPA